MGLCILANNALVTVNGSATNNALNDYSSRFVVGSSFTCTTSALQGKVAVVALLHESVTNITMSVTANGTTTAKTDAINLLYNLADSDGPYVVDGYVATDYVLSELEYYDLNTRPAYTGGKYVTVYLDLGTTSTTSFTVSFSSSVSISRLIIGNYWSPVYNTSYGVQIGVQDNTDYIRLQTGDLYSVLGSRNKTMQFDLQYLTAADKNYLFDIMRSVSKTKPIFVSVFPGSSDPEQEQLYSIYGRVSTPAQISYAMFSMYSSQLQLEEI